MGYEMYRLLNCPSDSTIKSANQKTKKQTKSTKNNDDEDSSSSSDQRWTEKKTKIKANLANIEKYRWFNIFRIYHE